MIMKTTSVLALVAMCGCSTTTRYVSTSGWFAPNTGAAAAPAPAGNRSLFLTYWEGECGGVHAFSAALFGGSRCSKGNGKIMRCALQSDNTLSCKEEADANKVLATD